MGARMNVRELCRERTRRGQPPDRNAAMVGTARGFSIWAAALVCLAIHGQKAAAVEILSDFQPSSRHSDYGQVRQVEFSTGIFTLDAKVLGYMQAGTAREFRVGEPVWVLGYKTEIYDSLGRPPRENYVCHTFVSDQPVMQGLNQKLDALYSDGFTREIRFPEGFGVLLTPDDDLHWLPLFNNRADSPAEVEMRVRLTLIREKDLKKPLRRLYATLRSVQLPHLFFVPPGRHEQQTTFEFPFDGRIHFMATHVHPHATWLELYDVAREKRVWKGNRTIDPATGTAAMEVYSDSEGYSVQAGESYRITSVYENPMAHKIDGMAGLFMFYSLEE